MAVVLKTTKVQAFGGSNPSPSALWAPGDAVDVKLAPVSRYTAVEWVRPLYRNSLALAVMVAVAAGFLVLGGLPIPETPLTTGNLTDSYMRSRPEARLWFPLSRPVWEQAGAEGPYDPMLIGHPPGNAPASVSLILEAPLPPNDSTASLIWGWYREQLRLRGWHLVSPENKAAGDYAELFGRGLRERIWISFDYDSMPGPAKYDGHGAVYTIHYEVASCSDPASRC